MLDIHLWNWDIPMAILVFILLQCVPAGSWMETSYYRRWIWMHSCFVSWKILSCQWSSCWISPGSPFSSQYLFLYDIWCTYQLWFALNIIIMEDDCTILDYWTHNIMNSCNHLLLLFFLVFLVSGWSHISIAMTCNHTGIFSYMKIWA